jgi:hypothetical protein
MININEKLSDEVNDLIKKGYEPFYFNKIHNGSLNAIIYGCIIETEDYIILEYAEKFHYSNSKKHIYKINAKYKSNHFFSTTSTENGNKVVIENEDHFWRFSWNTRSGSREQRLFCKS